MNDKVELILILLPILLLSMAVHEMMHALASDKLGDDTARVMGRLTLNPLAHIDPYLTVGLPLLMLLTNGPLFGAAKPVQVNFSRLRYAEFGGAIVGMIGPLTNLAIGGVAAIAFNTLNPSYGSLLYNILDIAIRLNVGLFVFNSIPWPPLDGSRLLYAFAPRALQQLMETIEQLGIAGLLLFILFIYQFGGFLAVLMDKLAHLLAPGLVL